MGLRHWFKKTYKKAKNKIENTAEDAGDAIEDAAHEVEKGVNKAGYEIEKLPDKVKREAMSIIASPRGRGVLTRPVPRE